MEGLIILVVVIGAIVIVVSGDKGHSNSSEEVQITSKRSREIEYFEKKWQDIVDLFDSNNENDWRMAIIEADILISNIMTFNGVPGNNHMEKISCLSSKKINKETLYSLHKIRNRVAHQGVGFPLDRNKVDQIKESFENAILRCNV